MRDFQMARVSIKGRNHEENNLTEAASILIRKKTAMDFTQFFSGKSRVVQLLPHQAV